MLEIKISEIIFAISSLVPVIREVKLLMTQAKLQLNKPDKDFHAFLKKITNVQH